MVLGGGQCCKVVSVAMDGGGAERREDEERAALRGERGSIDRCGAGGAGEDAESRALGAAGDRAAAGDGCGPMGGSVM